MKHRFLLKQEKIEIPCRYTFINGENPTLSIMPNSYKNDTLEKMRQDHGKEIRVTTKEILP